MGVSGSDFAGMGGGGVSETVKNVHALPMDGRVWLALWPAANPAGRCFAFGLAAVSRSWAAMNGLNVKKFGK